MATMLAQKLVEMQEANDAVRNFMRRFEVGKLLGACRASKAKGFSVVELFRFLLCCMFSQSSMYMSMQIGTFKENFSKNTIYRFCSDTRINWHKLVRLLSAKVISEFFRPATSDKRIEYFIFDDTPFAKSGKKTELVAKFLNHVSMKYECGFRILTLLWTDEYYETRYEDFVLGNTDDFAYSDIVARSFGEGLSYTKFAFSDFQVTEEGDGFAVTVTVKNVEDMAGKEVVQVYAQSPYTQYDRDNGIEKASVQLMGFDKTDLLQPGESQTVTVRFEKRNLASYDAVNAKTYILDAGEYYITVAEGAHDAVNHILTEKNADAEKMIPAQTTYETAESLTYKFTQDALDSTSYATSAETGAAITNLFEEADINLFDGGAQAVSYVTRSDWKGSFDDSSLETMLQSKISLNATDAIYKGLVNEQFEKPEGADQVKMPTMKAENGLVLADFVGVGRDEAITKHGKEWTFDDLLDQMNFVEMRSLILLGQHNTKNVASIAKPATSDQNGPCGFASTFVSGGSGTAFPSSTLRATTWNKALTCRVGEIIGEDGLHSGSNGLYGPGANIHRNAFCGRNYEYYSEDPILSSLIGTEECQGIQSRGIIVYEKHFALNDSESHREGVGTWANEQAIREIYLTAFHRILSRDGGNAHAIMTGFNRLGTTWTGDSINLIDKVARGEWGFDGFSCTDMDKLSISLSDMAVHWISS